MRKLLLLCSLGLAASGFVRAQMPKWCSPPVLFDWSNHTQTTVPASFSGSSGNAAYDESGNLLFYIDGSTLVDEGGWQIAVLNGTPYEANIVKVPGTCKDYYVIYSTTAPTGNASVYYLRLTWSGSGWNIGSNTTLPNVSGPIWCNMAVSKQRADRTRFLFLSKMGRLCKYLISNTGISYVSTVADGTAYLGYIFVSGEAELYEDANGYKYVTGDLYAGGSAPKIGVITMNLTGDYVSKTNLSSTSGVVGLEFVNSNQVLVSSRASNTQTYMTMGLYNISGGGITPLSGTANCVASDIEKAADGKYYTVGQDGGNKKLVELTPATLSRTLTSYLYNLDQFAPGGAAAAKFPDQVDNENYLSVNYRADLVIKDEPGDMGIEPTAPNLMTTEGDIWNCNDNLNCGTNENPRSTETDIMHVKIYNYGCKTSQPAQLHMHWTRARSGEWWTEHWYDMSLVPSNQVGGNPAGGEITVQPGTAISDPMTVPALLPGQSVVLSKEWEVPDRAWYPLNAGGNDGTNPMICFLARVTSAEDPITNQQTNVVVNDYVKRNNNVATRNSFILPTDGERPGRIDGTLMIYNPEEGRLVTGIRIRGVNTAGIDHLHYVDIVMESALYQRWAANGRKGIGIADKGNNTIRITDYNLAEISGIDVSYQEGFNIVPSVMLNVDNPPASDKRLYSFVVDHFYADRSTGSPGIYHVDYHATAVARMAGSGNTAAARQPVLSPNPTTGVLHITYAGMGEQATITLYDNLGRKVQQQSLSGASNTINIDRLPAGLYFYRIDNGKERFEGKVVKE